LTDNLAIKEIRPSAECSAYSIVNYYKVLYFAEKKNYLSTEYNHRRQKWYIH